MRDEAHRARVILLIDEHLGWAYCALFYILGKPVWPYVLAAHLTALGFAYALYWRRYDQWWR